MTELFSLSLICLCGCRHGGGFRPVRAARRRPMRARAFASHDAGWPRHLPAPPYMALRPSARLPWYSFFTIPASFFFSLLFSSVLLSPPPYALSIVDFASLYVPRYACCAFFVGCSSLLPPGSSWLAFNAPVRA